MKKGIIFILAMLLAAAIVFLLLKPSTTGYFAKQIPEEQSELSVYFCPERDCLSILENHIEMSKSSVHCAFYNIGAKILNSLSEKNNEGVDVKLVLDEDSKDNAVFARKNNGNQLMHNKFCIFDGRTVFTGSFNPTEGGAKDANNMVIADSQTLAENYEDEFNELWNGEFGRGEKTKNPKVVLNDRLFENYFCPEDGCAEKVAEEIRQANKSIHFMLFSFTHPKIATGLVLKQKEGLEIKGVMEKSQNSRYSKYDLLKYQGIEVKWAENKNLMHNKVFIIDSKTVITGSFNPTENADERNDENMLIIHDEAIAREYLEEFEGLLG